MTGKMTDANMNGEQKSNAGNGKKHRKRILIPVFLILIVGIAAVIYWYFFLRG
jgi:flagellar basal body-associated protein FliL